MSTSILRCWGCRIFCGGSAIDIELRLSKDLNERMLLFLFHWCGECQALSEIKKHYPMITITDTSRGHSGNEVTSNTTPAGTPGETVTYNFIAIVPDCLSGVIISRE